jgi:hypothetical protein
MELEIDEACPEPSMGVGIEGDCPVDLGGKLLRTVDAGEVGESGGGGDCGS